MRSVSAVEPWEAPSGRFLGRRRGSLKPTPRGPWPAGREATAKRALLLGFPSEPHPADSGGALGWQQRTRPSVRVGNDTPWSSAQFLGRFCFEARKTGRSSSWRGNGRRDPGLRTPLKACGQSHRTQCSVILPSLSGQGGAAPATPHTSGLSHTRPFSLHVPGPRPRPNGIQTKAGVSFPGGTLCFLPSAFADGSTEMTTGFRGVAVGCVCVEGQRGGDTGPPGAIATTQAVSRTKNPTGQSSTAIS